MIGLYKTLISSRVKGQRIPQVSDVVTHVTHLSASLSKHIQLDGKTQLGTIYLYMLSL